MRFRVGFLLYPEIFFENFDFSPLNGGFLEFGSILGV
jgi:hypothetical protein